MPQLPTTERSYRFWRPRFRVSVWRGIAIALPPILTIVILLWIAGTVESYLLKPVEDTARQAIVWSFADIRVLPRGNTDRSPQMEFDGQPYQRLRNGDYIPQNVYDWLRANVADEPVQINGVWTESWSKRGEMAYVSYVDARYLRRSIVLPVFLIGFILLLYFIGKLLAVGFGEFIDRGIQRLPLIRSIYGSVKKVTNFVFVDSKVHYKRVVAIEYPRKGIWSIGLVTGEGVSEVGNAAREPCVTVLLPGSPTPITGYCVMVPTRETHDLNMTIDQALHFYISGGVVVPPLQQTTLENQTLLQP
ncbi:MAG: DUF502 domain-containing protein [Planctomycetota bacterium]|nr:DUF502 domain-containing protein [Planctomycetota bacterium]